MSEQDRYTPEEWRTLQFAPFWIFSAVIGAYDRVDPRDEQVFVRCLEAATLAGGRLRRELLASVVGYDDSSLSRLAHVNLTTVSQDAPGQAEHAVAAATERLDGGRSGPREVVLAPRLVVRGTTGPPPSAPPRYPGQGTGR